MADAKSAGKQAAATTETQESSLLDQIVSQGRFGTDSSSRERGKNL